MDLIKVLVVDDEPGIRSGVARVLRDFTVSYPFMDEACKFEVIEAPTGEDAIQIVNTNLPDIILLDNKLPGIQGIEVLEYISKNQIDVIVVMITSYASLEVAVRANKSGAFDFIPKPFTPQELRSSIETITKQVYFRRMAKKLNTAGKQIRFQFLSVLSHELKAPLNAIEGYLRMIQEKQMGDNLEDYEQVVNRSLDRIQGMRQLILDLLDLTRIESGSLNRNLQNIDIVQIAQISMDTVRPLAIQRDITLNFNHPETLMFNIDAKEIEIVLNNFLSNAIKYNRDGGQVFFTLKVADEHLHIVVEDTGIGMTEEEMTRLFKEFVRIKNQKTKNISGSGLGLSIVKKIIDSYNGDIMLTSTPDKGSTFTVSIPFTT